MAGRKIILLFLILIFSTSIAFAQTEVLKSVVNNLAFYKQKKELKYLSSAKRSVDSVIVTHADSVDLEKNVYKVIVYASIAYIDSLNKLKLPNDFFFLTVSDLDKLIANKKSYRYQAEIDYCKHAVANVFLRHGFKHIRVSDYNGAIFAFMKAKKYAPDFKIINAYIAYANNMVGDLLNAGKYYTDLLKTDSTKAEYFEAASNTFKTLGDTAKALQILQKGRKHLPADPILLLDEANIYNNKHDYQSLEPLLAQLLNENVNNEEVAFVAANCYDHLDKFDKAESLYLRAIELNGSVYGPVYNLGILYLKVGLLNRGNDSSIKDIGRAEQWLQKANEISPNDIKCLQLLQLVYIKTGNQDQIEKTNAKLKLLTN